MLLSVLLGMLVVISVGLGVWQLWVGILYGTAGRSPQGTLRDRLSISVLKPLKGCDEQTQACLESWLNQNYNGPWEVLFGVTDSDDPVCELAEQTIAAHPGIRARLVICEGVTALNPKVGKLERLEEQAAHEWLVVSDADVRVAPDFLARFAPSLTQSNAGMSHCLYMLDEPSTWALRWEAVAVNADFWSQALQARSLGWTDFALGAVMGFSRAHLRSLGGFEAIANDVADDFQLGHRTAQTGRQIILAGPVVQCLEGRAGWGEVWRHQLRWARTIRFSRPGPYALSILGNATLWPCLWWLGMTWNGGWGWPGLVLLGCLGFRVVSALYLQAKLTGRWDHAAWWWMVPLKDGLQAALWIVSFLGREVIWKGDRMRLGPGGRLLSSRPRRRRNEPAVRRKAEV